MRWDKSARPKRLRRKQKRIILLVAVIGAVIIVSITGFWNDISNDESFSVIGFVSELLTDEEKQTVWNGMSDEGKAVILKHTPDVK